MDDTPAADLTETTLSARIIAGLEGVIWQPGDEVGLFDQWEAVQMLGRFADPAALAALGQIVAEGGRSLPAPGGRWLRDTALDTLLTTAALPRVEVDGFLRRYYNLGRRVLRGRPERDLVYDDLPRLVHHGRAGLVLVIYLLPLLGILLALAVLGEGLALLGFRQRLGGLTEVAFFVGVGLLAYNLYQVVLVGLAASLGPRLALPPLGARGQAGLALGLIALLAGLTLHAMALTADMRYYGYRAAPAGQLMQELMILPLLLAPAYLLAHDLERGTPAGGGRVAVWMPRVLARSLRLLLSLLYGVYLYATLTLWSFFVPPTANPLPAVKDLGLVLASWPALGYLLLAPLAVMGGLTALGGGLARLPRLGLGLLVSLLYGVYLYATFTLQAVWVPPGVNPWPTLLYLLLAPLVVVGGLTALGWGQAAARRRTRRV